VAAETWSRLAADGFEVVVLAANPPNRGPRAGSADCNGVQVVSLPGLDLSAVTGAQVLVARGLLRRAREVAEEFAPHVLHAHSLHFQTTVAAARLARGRGVPLATTVHVAGIADLPLAVRSATALWERTVGRFVIQRSDALLAVSESVAEHAIRRGARPDAVQVVPNGVDVARFVPGEPAAPPVIAFVGRLIANKGPDVLVRATSQAVRAGADLRVEIIGDGPMRPALEAMVAKDPLLADRVTFTGFDPDVASRLATASVLVRPSTTEGMPLAVLEAMAAGTAVVATDIAPNRELISHGITGLLFPVGEVGALTRCLLRLVDDHGLRRSLAAAGRAKAASHSWEVATERTGAALAGLVADASRKTEVLV